MIMTRESSPFPGGLEGRAGGKPGAEAFVNLSASGDRLHRPIELIVGTSREDFFETGGRMFPAGRGRLDQRS